MNKTKFNFFKQIQYAVAKPMEYFRLSKISGGRMTGFVFLFVLITSLFTIIPIFNAIAGSNGVVKYLREDLPSFQMINGELTVEGRHEEKENGNYFLVDTNIEQFSLSDIDYSYDSAVLISKTNAIVYQYGSPREFNFSDFRGFNFNNTFIENLLPLFYVVMVIVAIFIYLVMVAWYFITSLFFSLIGMIISSSMKITLPYAAIFKIAVYSKVTSTILSALFDIIPVNIPGILIIMLTFIITFVYVIYGIKSCNSDAAHSEDNFQMPTQGPFM